MQKYSIIRTFYIKRKNRKVGLPERQSDMERVVLPAMAYKMSLTTNARSENILVRTAVDLMKVYERQGLERGIAMDLIAEKMKLDPLLVRAILRRNKNNLDRETGVESEGLTQKFYYLIYNALSGRVFPEMIPADDFAEGCLMEPAQVDFKYKITPKLRFQIEMKERIQSAWILHTADSFFSAPQNPPVSEIERRYCRRRDNSHNSLIYLGIAEPIGLICTCYLQKKDLSTIHMMNPIGEGNLDQIYDHIQEVLQKEKDVNEELSRRLEEMDARRRDLLENVENSIDARNKAERELLTVYPGIKVYPEVQKRVVSLEARCAAYAEAAGKGSEMADEKAKECVIAIYEALEEIFARSLIRNYPHDHAQRLEELLEPLRGNEDYTEYYLGIAEMAGFERPERCSSFFKNEKGRRLKNGKMKGMLKRAEKGQDLEELLPEMVAAHMFQAAVKETHPFREIVVRCPDILTLTRKWKEARDVFKHNLDERDAGGWEDAAIPPSQEITQMKVLTEMLVEVLLGVPRSTQAEQRHQEETMESQKAAKIRANEAIASYPALKFLVEKTAIKVLRDFYYQDPAYFSACSNLLSEMYDVLFREYSTQDQRKAAAAWFSGDKDTDDAAIHGLFKKLGCDYDSDDKPATWRINQFSYNVKDLSVKCKLYLAAVMLDREDPDLLQQLLEQAPKFPQLTDQICRGRGHKNMATFEKSPDGYKALQQELMETCNRFCGVLLSAGQRGTSTAENLPV